MKPDIETIGLNQHSLKINYQPSSKLNNFDENCKILHQQKHLNCWPQLETLTEDYPMPYEFSELRKILMAFEIERLRALIDSPDKIISVKRTNTEKGRSIEKSKSIKKKLEKEKLLNELNVILEDKNKTIASLTSQNSEITQKLELSLTEIKQQLQMNFLLEERIGSNEDFIRSLQEKEKVTREELEQAKIEHKKLVEFQEVEYFAKLLSKKNKHKEDLQSVQSKLINELNSEKEKLKSLQINYDNDISKQSMELQDIIEQYNSLEIRTNELESKTENQAFEIHQLADKNQKLFNKQNELFLKFEDEKEKLIFDFEKQQEENELEILAECNQNLKEMEIEYKALIEQKENEFLKIFNENQILKNQQGTNENMIQELQKQFKSLEFENATLSTKNEQLIIQFETQINNYRMLIPNYDDLELRFEGERSNFRETISLLTSKNVSLKNTVAILNEEVKSLRRESIELKKKELEEIQLEKNKLMGVYDDMDAQITNLKSIQKDKDILLSKEIFSNKNLQNKLTMFETQLDELQKNNFLLQNECNKNRELAQQFKIQLKDENRQIKILTQTKNEIEKALLNCKEEQLELQVQFLIIKREKENFENEAKRLETQLTDRTDDLNNMIRKLKEAELKHKQALNETEIAMFSTIFREKQNNKNEINR